MANCETTEEIERAVGRFFRPRVNIVVPNTSWGMGVHECDLFVLSKSNYAIEVEIKVSKSDLVKDKNKRHGHCSDKIKKLFFAIPEKLNTGEIIAHIPERAGIIVVGGGGRCRIIRPAENNKSVKKLGADERLNLLRLAYLRYWDMRCIRPQHYVGDGLGI